MDTKTSEIVELPNEERESEGPGLCYVGIDGTASPESMADRQRRGEMYRARVHYRECVPCDKCTNCLELRGFRRDGREYIKTWLCIHGEYETTPMNTCDQGRVHTKGRKKVVYDLENAPKGFEAGLADKQVKAMGVASKSGPADFGLIPADGYRAGIEQYKRKIDGRRLMN